MIHVDHPYRIAVDGRTATTDWADHVRDLVEQLLFTSPGERVNRPDFGCGLAQLVFEPNSEELVATVETMVAGALQRWLAEVIEVVAVRTEAEESTLRVAVAYELLPTGEQVVAQFEREVA